MSLDIFYRRRLEQEIEWCMNRQAELIRIAHERHSAHLSGNTHHDTTRGSSYIKEYKDLERQIKEKKVSLMFDDYASIVPDRRK